MAPSWWRKLMKSKKSPKHGRQAVQERHVPSVEALEERVMLHGQLYALVVSGLGGYADPPPTAVIQHLQQLGYQGLPGSLSLDSSTWNATWNALDGSGDPGAFNVGVTSSTTIGGDSSFAGGIINGLGSIIGTKLPNKITVPTGLGISVDIGSPNTNNNFVNDAVNIINGLAPDDQVVLIGHSLGGSSVLDIARETTHQIALLALLDPVGYAPTSTFDPSSYLPPRVGISFPNGLVNGNHEIPGFRFDLPGVPSNVTYFYNRWQTNGPFPLDYPISGVLPSAAHINNQGPENSTASPYQPHLTDASVLAYLFGGVDVNPLDIGSSDFGKSSAQLHYDFAQNTYVQSDLTSILDQLQPPTASAVARDFSGNIINAVNEGQQVTLDASNSVDPNPAGTLSYQWTQVGGAYNVQLSDTASKDPTIQLRVGKDTGASADDPLQFQVTVTDGSTGLTDTADVAVSVINVPPTAKSVDGPSKGVIGQTLSFTGTYSDPGITGDPATTDHFTYAFDAVDSSNQVVASTTNGNFNFTPSLPGTYTVNFTVTDDAGTQDTTSKTVQATLAGLIPDPSDPTQTALLVRTIPGGSHSVVLSGTVGDVDVKVDGVDQGTFAPTGQILVSGNSGNDTLTLDFSHGDFISPAGLVWDGGAGTNSLAVLGRGKVWTVTGHNQGFLNGGITFVNTQNLTGGDQADDFIFQAPGFIDGNVTAGGGYDTLDLGAQPSQPITLSSDDTTGFAGFTPGTSPIGGTFSGIDDLISSSVGTTSTLYGLGVDSQWNITASGPSHYTDLANNRTLDFSNIENLTGGSGADAFVFDDGATVAGAIDGGDGKNTLDYTAYTTPVSVNLQTQTATGTGSFANIDNLVGGAASDTLVGADASNVWHITGNNQGDVNGVFTFSSVENLTGGARGDRYVFSNGKGVEGIIDGKGGSNTLDYSAYTSPVTVNLQSHTATGTGGFANIDNLVGGAASDTLVGADTPNVWHITGNNRGDVNGLFTFSSIENLTGGAREDRYVFSAGQGVSGVIDGKGGSDTLDYSAYTSPVTANLQSRTATGTGGFANIDNLVGGSASDTLVGADAPNVWYITGSNRGNINGVFAFSSIENLTGGALDDRYVFSNGKGVSGTIDGKGGSDTLDYSAYTTPVSVNLQSRTATGTGGFANIDNLVGGSAADTLVGADAPNVWYVTGSNRGNINGIFGFSSIENLTGGALDDRYVFSDGQGVSGVIEGKGGSNTLDYSAYTTPVSANLQTQRATGMGSFANIDNLVGGAASDTLVGADTPNVWHITGNNRGDVNGLFTFSSVENLTGSDTSDDFLISDGTSESGLINGGGGTNTLETTQDANFTLTNSTLLTSDGTSLHLANIQVADLTGGPSDNTFDVSGWTGSGTLSGGSGSDTVVASKDTDFSLSNSALSTSDGMSLTLIRIGTANLTGGPGDNSFNVSDWSGVANLDGGAGNNSYVVTLSGLGSGQTNITGSGTTGSDTLLVLGTPGNDIFTITAGQVAAGGEVVNSSGVPNRTVTGAGGTDIFNVLVTAANPFALVVESGVLNVLDVTGGAQITNIPFDALTGLVTAVYPGGSASVIAYQGSPLVNPGLAHVLVQGLFRDFVQRYATLTEADFWAERLQSTGDLQGVARDILNLPEARAREVDGWIRLYLGQEPLPGEEVPWVFLFQEGFTDDQVLATFLNQPTYYAQAGFQDPVVIQVLSDQLRERPATPDEVVALENVLHAQESRYGAAEMLLESPEHRALVVEADFQSLLGRPATEAELEGIVFSGLDFTSIDLFLATTPEFLQHRLTVV